LANAIIRLRIDPVTGKKDVIIDYTSDSDALPIEHEEIHRKVMDRLIEGGAISAAEVGKIIIRRDGEEAVP
jgi:hypothetical protein